MDVEEKIEKLIQKCIEKDKFIQRIGNILKGCRCGIVTTVLLDELGLAESQLEKSDYQQLLSVSPLVHSHTRIRLQGGILTGGDIVSVPLNSTVSNPVSWSHVGALGALSSTLLPKPDDRQTRTAEESFHTHNVEQAHFVSVSENRTYIGQSERNVSENFVTRTNVENNNRYSDEGNISTSSTHYMSQVVSLPETEQFHGSVNISTVSEEYESETLQNGGEEQLPVTDATGERYSEQINNTDNRFTEAVQPSGTEQNDRYINRHTSEARSLLTNLTDFAYPSFVDNVQFAAVSPAESNSEMYPLQTPVISMQMSDNRVQHLAAFKSNEYQQTADVKGKSLPLKPKQEVSRTSRRYRLDLKCNYPSYKHRCDVCGKSFSKPSKLNEHVRVHTGEKPFKCSTCQKCFAQSGTLKYHMRIHSGEKPFSCSDCGKTFTQPGQLSSHQLIHREKFYKCHLCKKSFPEETLLERHVKIHKKERPYKCDKCGKCFLHSGNHLLHVQKCNISKEDFKCKECGEIFTSKDNLEEHDEEHSKDKPHQCDVCLRRYKRPLRLKKHKCTHVDVKKEKSHMCELCGQCYGKPSLLKIHMRIHTGEKPFMCDFCGKFLGSANNLRRHVLSHTGERNFKCSECGKSFSTAHNLEYHSRVHTGIKPFKCDTCGKGFPFSFSLDRHMRTHKKLNRA